VDNKLDLVVLLCAFLATTSCKETPPEASSATPVSDSTRAALAFDSAVAEFSHGAELVVEADSEYDRPLGAIARIHWNAQPSDGMVFDDDTAKRILSRVVLDSVFPGGTRILLWSSYLPGEGCPPCQARIGSMIRKNGKWIVRRNLGAMGTNGRLHSPIHVATLADGQFLFAFDGSGGNMGEFQEVSEFLLLDSTGAPRFSSALLGANNAGACDSTEGNCWGYTSSVDWIASELPTRINLRQSGTALSDSNARIEVRDTAFELRWHGAQ